MNSDELKGSWNNVAGAVKEKYGQVTSDDISKAEGNIQALIGTIQKKTGETREVIEDFIRTAGASTSGYVNRVYDQASEYAGVAAEEIRGQYDRVSHGVQEGVESARDMVYRRPMESVLTAFGLGLAAGVIAAITLSSRRR